MLTRQVQSVPQFTVSHCSLSVVLSFIAASVMSVLFVMTLSADSSILFSCHVSVNAMNSTLMLVTVLHLNFHDLPMLTDTQVDSFSQGK